jgi:hypothetical protein
MSAVVRKVSSMLDISTPHHGGISLRKSKSSQSPSSPVTNRQSLMEPLSALFSGKKESSRPEKRCVKCGDQVLLLRGMPHTSYELILG